MGGFAYHYLKSYKEPGIIFEVTKGLMSSLIIYSLMRIKEFDSYNIGLTMILFSYITSTIFINTSGRRCEDMEMMCTKCFLTIISALELVGIVLLFLNYGEDDKKLILAILTSMMFLTGFCFLVVKNDIFFESEIVDTRSVRR